MKEAVLNTEDILRPEIIQKKGKVLILNHEWQKLEPLRGKGYFLEMDRWLKESRSEGRLLIEPISYEEFLEWCNEDTWAEWVNGKVIILSPASRRHQELVRFLLQILNFFAEERGLGVVLCAPFQMKTGPDLPGREPDLLFVSKERENLLKETYLQGPADLVVEVTSEESRLRDKEEKFEEYEKGGVREYWVIDPELREANFYRRDEEGKFREQKPNTLGIYYSQVLSDFKLKVSWLWEEPLPPVRETLQELELI